jgi:hypothetical protein
MSKGHREVPFVFVLMELPVRQSASQGAYALDRHDGVLPTMPDQYRGLDPPKTLIPALGVSQQVAKRTVSASRERFRQRARDGLTPYPATKRFLIGASEPRAEDFQQYLRVALGKLS